MTKLATVSVVIPVLNESASLVQLHAELRGVCDRLPYAFRVRLRGRWEHGRDGGDVCRKFSGLDERVRYLVLSRNFGPSARPSSTGILIRRARPSS